MAKTKSNSLYSDLHCHPVSWSFNRMRNTKDEKDPKLFHPWNIPESNERKREKGARAYTYSQCDLESLAQSNTRLVFASLYPFEKGFFDEKLIGKGQRKEGKRTLMDSIQGNKMGLSRARVEYFQSKTYDYFKELEREYDFYVKSNLRETPHGRYRIASNKDDVKASLSKRDEVSFILTVEGMHSLGLGNPPKKGKDVDLNLVKQRIKALKGEGPADQKWKFPVFFITFAHHFDNTLCGHAHSFPKISEVLFNQDKNVNRGLFDRGYEIILELLGLKNDLTDNGQRRILIDVKHMSASARKDYYNRVIKPRNALRGAKKIPVVASHMGYSGAKYLDELITDAHREKDNFKKDKFYAWNINLCDEDISVVHESEGLIGLSFDQRILGTDMIIGFIAVSRRNNIRAFIRMIKRIVDVPYSQNLSKPESIWDRLTIGTDFEGFINPIDKYSTAEDFPDFEKDLTREFDKMKKANGKYFEKVTPAEAARKICFKNAQSFVMKHFH